MSQLGDAVRSSAPAFKSAKVEKVLLHNPDPTYCSYYVSRKHRFCRTECKPGSLYCCTHDVAHNDEVEVQPQGKSSHGETQVGASAASGGAGSGGDVRVPCPINPNHTVYTSRMERHVKVCPDLRFVTTQLPYFCEDKHANKGAAFVTPTSTHDAVHPARRTHRDLSPDDLSRLMRKVSECYDTCVEPEMVVMPSLATTMATTTTIPTSTSEGVDGPPSSAAAVMGEASPAPPSHGEATSQKHGPQHAALLRCLSDVVLQSSSADSVVGQYANLRPDFAKSLSDAATPLHVDGFLEFGAGKGGLSVALQQLLVQRQSPSDLPADHATEAAHAAEDVVPGPSSWSFLDSVAAQPQLVVLDMDGFRRKGDARVRHSAVPLRRLRINIKDVDLTRAFLTEIHSPPSHSSSSPTPATTENWAVLGKHLCGACTDFALSCLTEAPSLSREAHVRLPVVVIATCCHHRCELRHLNPPVNAAQPAVLTMPGSTFTWSADEFAAMTSMSSWAVCGGFVDEARRRVGWQCKRVLDQLRVHFLRQLGYVAFQCQYTTRDVTEENVCIVAFQPEKQRS